MPAIIKPSVHFNVVTDTGANILATAQAVFPSNYMIWIKDRANANNHQIIDTVRGASAVLQSNTTAAETTYTAPTGNSVAWCFKAGGAAVTNTAGSISAQVSANPSAGFSIVTYTGSTPNQTVGHGLGVAPKLVMVKSRNNASSWAVWHTALAGTEYLLLESTAAKATAATVWNSTVPTSSVFSVGSGSTPNSAGYTYVAYCFAEIAGYSKFGSYTGNGSADGPFVFCGFRPKFIMAKDATNATSASWLMQDTTRDAYNVGYKSLYANDSSVESVSALDNVDIVSNGFKVRNTSSAWNNSGQTFIFIAFAEAPFQYSLAR